MQLTLFSDYALRLLLYLGVEGRGRHGGLVPIQSVAEAYGVSRNYMLKVAHDLVQRGYIEAVRGRNGGVRLAVEPAAIKLGELVRHMEPERGVLECVREDHSDCPIHHPCRLRPLLGEAEDAFYAVLDRHSLADILEPRAPLTQILLPEAQHGTS